jgi:hypothetical protein
MGVANKRRSSVSDGVYRLAIMKPTQVVVHEADHLATWLTFIGAVGGAIIVAIIAAVTAEKRLKAQLASEERRHRNQMEFDRGETDRAELRRIVDGLAKQLLIVQDVAGSARAVISTSTMLRSIDNPDLLASEKARWKATRDRLRDATDALSGYIQQLNLRLGPEAETLVELASATGDATDVIWINLAREPPTVDGAKDEIGKAYDKITKANREFVQAAHAYMQARLMKMSAQAEPSKSAIARPVEGTPPPQSRWPHLIFGRILPAGRPDEAYQRTFRRWLAARKRPG